MATIKKELSKRRREAQQEEEEQAQKDEKHKYKKRSTTIRRGANTSSNKWRCAARGKNREVAKLGASSS